MADEGSSVAAAAAPSALRASSELGDAAAKGDVDRVQELLAAGADVAQVDEEQGMTPLMLAARHGHADVVRALLQAGAPWNALNPSGLCAGKEEVTVFCSSPLSNSANDFACQSVVLLLKNRVPEEIWKTHLKREREREMTLMLPPALVMSYGVASFSSSSKPLCSPVQELETP
jgi:ankyrin repeat protein